jgi:integrase
MAIYQRGKTYWYSFTFNGRRVQKSAKVQNAKEAANIEKAAWTQLARGEVGLDAPKRERRAIGELLDALQRNYEDNDKLSPQNKSLIARAKADFDSKLATELSSDEIAKYIERRKKEGAKPSSINRVTEVIRRAFTIAGLTAPRMERLSEAGNARQGFLSEAELDALISHLPMDLQDFTRFAAACGMRKGEIAGLTWKMIEGDELRIPGNICKNRKGRVLPLTGELAEIIERRRAALSKKNDGTLQMPEHVFHRNGEAVAELRKSWQTAAIAAGLGIMICEKCEKQGPEKYCAKCKRPRKYQGKLFHDLRRSAVRNMVKAGVNTQVAKQWSGHKSDSMFERYSILTTDDMREAARKTEEYRKSQREQVVAIAK